MSRRANSADSYLPRMGDRSMRSGTELARDIQLTDWSRAREHVLWFRARHHWRNLFHFYNVQK